MKNPKAIPRRTSFPFNNARISRITSSQVECLAGMWIMTVSTALGGWGRKIILRLRLAWATGWDCISRSKQHQPQNHKSPTYKENGASVMTQWVMVPATEPNLSFVPRTHLVGGECQLLPVALCFSHACYDMYTPHVYISKCNLRISNIWKMFNMALSEKCTSNNRDKSCPTLVTRAVTRLCSCGG